jgi:hypothetical protein
VEGKSLDASFVLGVDFEVISELAWCWYRSEKIGEGKLESYVGVDMFCMFRLVYLNASDPPGIIMWD